LISNGAFENALLKQWRRYVEFLGDGWARTPNSLWWPRPLAGRESALKVRGSGASHSNR